MFTINRNGTSRKQIVYGIDATSSSSDIKDVYDITDSTLSVFDRRWVE